MLPQPSSRKSMLPQPGSYSQLLSPPAPSPSHTEGAEEQQVTRTETMPYAARGLRPPQVHVNPTQKPSLRQPWASDSSLLSEMKV